MGASKRSLRAIVDAARGQILLEERRLRAEGQQRRDPNWLSELTPRGFCVCGHARRTHLAGWGARVPRLPIRPGACEVGICNGDAAEYAPFCTRWRPWWAVRLGLIRP